MRLWIPGKIQAVQLRRALLLFALVLGLSALVASIVPPPEDPEERPDSAPAGEVPPGSAPGGPPAGTVRFTVAAAARGGRIETRRAVAGSPLSVEVSVPRPGDVTLEGLGLRQSADPLTPARFDLLAPQRGRQAVAFVPVSGRARVVGRLLFAEPATVRPPSRGR